MKAKSIVLIALFTALTAVLAQIGIPLPFSPVPFTLSILAVFLTGALLSEKQAVVSQVVYLLIGAIGIPVFSGFGGGLAKLVGPTGGYLAAYPLMALCVSFVVRRLGKKNLVSYFLGMLGALGVCYLLGTAWLAFVTKVPFVQGLAVGVYPFVAFDLVKVALSAVFATVLNRTLVRAKVL